jgi:hypothetical protein
LKAWGFAKYSKSDDYRSISRTLKRSLLAIDECDTYINDRLIPVAKLKKELGRHVPLTLQKVEEVPTVPRNVAVLPRGQQSFVLPADGHLNKEISEADEPDTEQRPSYTGGRDQGRVDPSDTTRTQVNIPVSLDAATRICLTVTECCPDTYISRAGVA